MDSVSKKNLNSQNSQVEGPNSESSRVEVIDPYASCIGSMPDNVVFDYSALLSNVGNGSRESIQSRQEYNSDDSDDEEVWQVKVPDVGGALQDMKAATSSKTSGQSK